MSNRLHIDEDCDCTHAQRAKWRPIAEIHEDYGACVGLNLADPGGCEIIHVCDMDFDASKWTHFAMLPTKNCAGCRFWSEMLAKAEGGGPVQAMCLADGGPQSGKYTSGRQTCSAFKSGHLGAVDDPPDYGEEVRAMYAAEEAEA